MLMVLLLSILSVTVINTADADVRAQVRQGTTFDARFTAENALEHYYAALLADPTLVESANLANYPATFPANGTPRWVRFSADGDLQPCPADPAQHDDCFTLEVFHGGRTDAAIVEARVRFECATGNCREATEVMTLRMPTFTQFLSYTDAETAAPDLPGSIPDQGISWQGSIPSSADPVTYSEMLLGFGSGLYRLADGANEREAFRPTPAVYPRSLTDIDSSDRHLCWVDNGGVFCQGGSNGGAIGNSDSQPSGEPFQVFAPGSGATQAFAAGAWNDHGGCAAVNGGVYCWGQMVAWDAPATEIIAPGSGVSHFDGNNFTACAVVNGGLQCWGQNSYRQANPTTTASQPTPYQVVPAGSGVTDVDVAEHTCYVQDGGLWCWGRNSRGQVGNNTTTNVLAPIQILPAGSGVVDVEVGLWHTCIERADGSISCWGDSSVNGLGFTQRVPGAPAIPAGAGLIDWESGDYHTCAAVDTATGDELRCWGLNALGDGATGFTHRTPTVSYTTPSQIRRVFTGADNTWIDADVADQAPPRAHVVDSTVLGLGDTVIEIPTDVEPGDLLVLVATQNGSHPPLPAGWTNITTGTGTGTIPSYGRVSYRWADSVDAGTHIPVIGTVDGSAIIVAVRGADRSDPIDVFATIGGSSSTMNAPAVVPTAEGLRLSMYHQNDNNTFWDHPSESMRIVDSKLADQWGAIEHHVAVYEDLDPATPGNSPQRTVRSATDSYVGYSIVVRDAAPAPDAPRVRDESQSATGTIGVRAVAVADSAADRTITIPASTQPGDLLALFVATTVGASDTSFFTSPLNGWTRYDDSTTGGYQYGTIFYRFATAADAGTSVYVAGGGEDTGNASILAVLSGVDRANPIFSHAETENPVWNAPSHIAAGAPSPAGGLRLSWLYNGRASAVNAPPSGVTELIQVGRGSFSGGAAALWRDNGTTTGATVPARSATFDITGSGWGHTLVFRPATPGQVAVPADTQVGDLLVLFASQTGSAPPTPAGWTSLDQTSNGATHGRISWRQATPADLGATVSAATGGGAAASIVAVDGANNGDAIEVLQNQTGSGTTVTAPAATGPSNALGLVFAHQATAGTSPRFTQTAGDPLWALTAPPAAGNGAAVWQFREPVTAATTGATLSSSQSGASVGYTLKIAAQDAPVGPWVSNVVVSDPIPRPDPPTIRSVTHRPAGATTMTIPASTQPGDLVLILRSENRNSGLWTISGTGSLLSSNLNNTGPGRAGDTGLSNTEIAAAPASAPGTETSVSLRFVEATASNIGTTLNLSHGTSRSAATMLVLANADRHLIDIGTTAQGSPIVSPEYEGPDGLLRFIWVAQTGASAIPTFSTPTGMTNLGSSTSSSTGRHRGTLYVDDDLTPVGGAPERSFTTNQIGGAVALSFSVTPQTQRPETLSVRIPNNVEPGDLMLMHAARGGIGSAHTVGSDAQAAGTNTVTVPAATRNGDWIVVFAAQTGSVPPLPAGFTSAGVHGPSGPTGLASRVSWKRATGTDASTTVTATSPSATRSAATVTTIRAAADPIRGIIDAHFTADTGTTIGFPAQLAGVDSLRFAAQMSDTATVPTFSAAPYGEAATSTAASSLRATAYTPSFLRQGHLWPARSAISDQSGSNVGWSVSLSLGHRDEWGTTSGMSSPTGWNSSVSGSLWSEYPARLSHGLFWRWAQPGDAGQLVEVAPDLRGIYQSATLVVVRDADPVSPFVRSSTTTANNPFVTLPGVNLSAADHYGTMIGFAAQMSAHEDAAVGMSAPAGFTEITRYDAPRRYSSIVVQRDGIIPPQTPIATTPIPSNDAGVGLSAAVTLRVPPPPSVIGDQLHGPVHTNGTEIAVCGEPEFHGDVTLNGTAQFTVGAGGFSAGACAPSADPTDPNTWLRGGATIAQQSPLGFPTSPASLVTEAQTSGYFYENAGASDTTTIEFRADGLMRATKTAAAGDTGPVGSWVAIPANGVVYVSGGAGAVLAPSTLNGRVHVVSDTYVAVNGDVRYNCQVSAGPCALGGDLLGITATDGVRLNPTPNTDLHLDAAVLILNGGLINNAATVAPTGNPPVFHLFGSLSARHRTITATYDTASGALTGGMIRHWNYDSRLDDDAPPRFLPPTAGMWMRVDSATTRPGVDLFG